jgi:hypothetical protein
VRLARGVSAKKGLANLNRIVDAANSAINADPRAAGNDGVSVVGVERPAQIVNYRTIGATPLVLAAGLVAGAVLALGLTLTASVRRRPARPCTAQSPRVHPTAAFCRHRLAGDRRRRNRRRRRHAAWDRHRTTTLDMVRTQPRRRARPHRTCPVCVPGGHRRCRFRQRCSCTPRAWRSAHPNRSSPTRRMKRPRRPFPGPAIHRAIWSPGTAATSWALLSPPEQEVISCKLRGV